MAQHQILSRSRTVPIRKQRRHRWRLWKLLIPISPLLLLSGWIGYRELEEKREIFAANFAHTHPNLPVWISGGAPKGYAKKVFKKAGVSTKNLHLDYQASDTVTNFTTLVDRFEAKGITSVYLVTSDDHMQRARSIGEIVFGSRGIKVKPITFTSGRPIEPIQKTLRDSCRSLLWLTTGYAGSKE
jgi:uncharacterized SAM-binding protein YcdF (DUF218 family)